jgi:hypothetical protein
MLDPDPYPDPHEINADPKPCKKPLNYKRPPAAAGWSIIRHTYGIIAITAQLNVQHD